MPRRIGIYSGTFDPVHVGHITFGTAALRVCRLDEVIFIPEPAPRNKQSVTELRHRLAMLQYAVAPYPKLRALTLETPRFTIAETLPLLRRLFPDAELTLLIGSDAAKTLLYRWEGLEQLLPEVAFAVGLRGNDTRRDIAKVMKQVEFIYQHQVRHTAVPVLNVATLSSSSARNGDFAALPPEVKAYIHQNDLYK
jgi:nicotinate-nucleotide adenylyltransferase